jgi:hypothetical protein
MRTIFEKKILQDASGIDNSPVFSPGCYARNRNTIILDKQGFDLK